MDIKKDKYEISVWEDILIPQSVSIPAHFEEQKIGVIGSDNLTAQWRATEPKLVENINGTNTLTFKMYYTYVDNITGEKVTNPWINLLINERKIKISWKNKWYDFVIKGIQEDSNGKSITYTCKDLYINELSKTGFDLEFDNELENNQGTVHELASMILKETDWTVAVGEPILQTREEPVYEIRTLIDIVAKNYLDVEINIPANSLILVYYSVIADFNNFFQFHYATDDFTYSDNSSMVVNNGDSLNISGVSYEEGSINDIAVYNILYQGQLLCQIPKASGVSNRYRANRLVRNQKQVLDTLVNQYVYVYTNADNKTIYGYSKTDYPEIGSGSMEVVVNGDFSSMLEGWSGEGLSTQLYPPFTTDVDATYSSKSYLLIPSNSIATNTKSNWASFLDGISKGSRFVFRYKAMGALTAGTITTPSGLYLSSTEGKIDFNLAHNNQSCIQISPAIQNGNWIEHIITFINGVAKYELSSLLLSIQNNSGAIRFIEEVQFFEELYGTPIVGEYTINTQYLEEDYVSYNNQYYKCLNDTINQAPNASNDWMLVNLTDTDGNLIDIRLNPGHFNGQSRVVVNWYFYEANQSLLSADNLRYIACIPESEVNTYISNNLIAVYDNSTGANGYEKIRSINAKQSNRFNLLQTLAETFECWIIFNIEHNEETGQIKYINGIPQKTVSFMTEIGEETGIGFVYGIDLKTISRTINSDNITSKVIVAQNNNSFGIDGFCTIARAKNNYSKTNFILNFDYYIAQGFLEAGQVNNDLYSNVSDLTGDLGYYYKLRQLNNTYDILTEELINLKNELTKQEAQKQVYQQLVGYGNNTGTVAEEITQLENDLANLFNYSYFNYTVIANQLQVHPDYEYAHNLWIQRNNLIHQQKLYTGQLNSITTSIENINNRINGNSAIGIESITQLQENIVLDLEQLDLAFFKKYSRFLQEGSWISEDYYDDDLYYLDAESVAYTSSRPQISYNISVLRLSALEEFKNKIFNLGDIAFIEDTEFFGYVYMDGLKTPYREKILVSEITSNFDSPEKDSFKVQNYKTQFEDLFQRITATTQSLQYSSGEYNKISNIITSTGEINPITLQRSFELNQDLVWSATNDSVRYDSTGITVIDQNNPAKQVRISSAGIYITNDGINWRLGISGDGINTQMLTAGIIHPNEIIISDGAYPTFRWDKFGINAFAFDYNTENQQIGNVYDTKFVRFDRFGLYGIDGIDGFDYTPSNEEQIWQDANFGLTWKGFFLRNKYGEGYIEISSEKDIVVSDGTFDRIKIGRLNDDNINPIFGLIIKNGEGTDVLRTQDNGTLWLQDTLNIGTSRDNTNVSIGKLPNVDTEHGNEIINATNNFIVYEDGYMSATGGKFSGEIEATGGTIGGLDIENVVRAAQDKEVTVTSDNGFVFLGNSPAQITLTANVANVENDDNLTYTWNYITFDDNNNVINGTSIGKTLIITNQDFPIDASINYTVTITETIDDNFYTYEGTTTIQKLSGLSVSSYELITNRDFVNKTYQKNNDGSISLIWDSDVLEIAVKSTSFSANENSSEIESFLNPNEYRLTIQFLDGNNWKALNYNLENIKQYFVQDDIYTKFYFTDFLSLPDGIEDYQIYGEEYENFSILFRRLINNSTVLKLDFYLGNSNVSMYTKLVQFDYSISADLAALSVNAYDINMAIGTTALTFSADGLTVKNGGLTIIQDDNNFAYTLSFDTIRQEGKTYYIQQEDGTYIEYIDDLVENELYYELTKETSTLLSYDEITKKLVIEGSGTFSGTVYASDGEFTGKVVAKEGEFTGTVNATSGIIGGFYIDQTKIYSQLEDGSMPIQIISKEILYDESGSPIGEEEGKIIVKNIELGTGAVIQDYLQLGSAYIYNPVVNNGKFISVVNPEDPNDVYISFNQDGYGNIGEIILDGQNSSIYGTNFSITPNKSIFNNVDVAGTIHASIFEIGEIQTASGAMIFKESAKIKPQYENGQASFIVSNNLQLQPRSIVLFVNDNNTEQVPIYGQIADEPIDVQYIPTEDTAFVVGKKYYEQINNGTNIIYEVTHDIIRDFSKIYYEMIQSYIVNIESITDNLTQNSFVNMTTVIHIADIDNDTGEYDNNLVIGVNSQSSMNAMLYPRAISFREVLNYENGQPIYDSKPKILLGELTNVLNTDKTTYGLYCNEAYLNGSLTTQVRDNSFAGVNTLHSVNAQIFNNIGNNIKADNSRIVFWAGAEDNSEQAIQIAPFQVTEQGSMYASQAYFNDSIFVGGKISAAEIHSAVIYGTTVDDNGTIPSLSIYDMGGGGIVFKDQYTRDSYTLMDSNIISMIYRPNTYYSRQGDEYILCTESAPIADKEYYIRASAPCDDIILQISNNGLTYNPDNVESSATKNYGPSTQFISFTNDGVVYNGHSIELDEFATSDIGNGRYIIRHNEMLYQRSNEAADDFSTYGGLSFILPATDNKICYRLGLEEDLFSEDATDFIQQDKGEIYLSSEHIQLKQDVSFGQGQGITMQFKRETEGYNLYISEN